jgi:hypothetical protein
MEPADQPNTTRTRVSRKKGTAADQQGDAARGLKKTPSLARSFMTLALQKEYITEQKDAQIQDLQAQLAATRAAADARTTLQVENEAPPAADLLAGTQAGSSRLVSKLTRLPMAFQRRLSKPGGSVEAAPFASQPSLLQQPTFLAAPSWASTSSQGPPAESSSRKPSLTERGKSLMKDLLPSRPSRGGSKAAEVEPAAGHAAVLIERSAVKGGKEAKRSSQDKAGRAAAPSSAGPAAAALVPGPNATTREVDYEALLREAPLPRPQRAAQGPAAADAELAAAQNPYKVSAGWPPHILAGDPGRAPGQPAARAAAGAAMEGPLPGGGSGAGARTHVGAAAQAAPLAFLNTAFLASVRSQGPARPPQPTQPPAAQPDELGRRLPALRADLPQPEWPATKQPDGAASAAAAGAAAMRRALGLRGPAAPPAQPTGGRPVPAQPENPASAVAGDRQGGGKAPSEGGNWQAQEIRLASLGQVGGPGAAACTADGCRAGVMARPPAPVGAVLQGCVP